MKKINTFRSGPFLFNSSYENGNIQNLVSKAGILAYTVKEIPVLPRLASGLQEEIIKRSIFGTAAIEGNPLSEDAVGKLINESDKTRGVKKAEIEIQNLKSVYYKVILPIVEHKDAFLLSEDFIQNINRTILADCAKEDVVPGDYRNHEVYVGDKEHGGVYVPPKIIEDIRALMQAYVEWINEPEVVALGPFVRAPLAHYYLGRIHPFGDGNGRTSRIVEAVILQAAGVKYVPLMLSNYYYKNIDAYYWAFSLSGKKDNENMAPFLEYFLNGVIFSCEQIKDRMFWMIRKFALRDYYQWMLKNRHISNRQFDLLVALFEKDEKFTLRDLYDRDRFAAIYRRVSERTSRRDLENLKKEALLLWQDGQYSLNFYVLDRDRS